jgi:hypothetical protein
MPLLHRRDVSLAAMAALAVTGSNGWGPHEGGRPTQRSKFYQSPVPVSTKVPVSTNSTHGSVRYIWILTSGYPESILRLPSEIPPPVPPRLQVLSERQAIYLQVLSSQSTYA